MNSKIPDHTAVRVALWRALHLRIDSAPHILKDEVGLKLVAPEDEWPQRPDMHPQMTMGSRASIVARARFIEDLMIEKMSHGVDQYVILGAGLDTFAQRKPELASKLHVFEVDKPETQEWKQQRLIELGYGIPNWLHMVPVDFEGGQSWWSQLVASGFKTDKPAVVASTGVSMYLTKDAITATLRQITKLAPGSTLAMTYMLPLELLDPPMRPIYKAVYERAAAAGTPFISFFSPEEIIALALECGFKKATQIGTVDLSYFDGRSDGFRPAKGESILIAST